MNLPTKPPRKDSLKALIGRSASLIDTPALVVDLDAMMRNVGRMAEFAKKHDVRWRPHAKTHKSAAIARLQMQAGAVGVCVQKTSEAEALAAGGVTDIFITNEVVAPSKLARVATLAHALAKDNGRLSIAVDSSIGVQRLAEAMNNARTATGTAVVIDVYVEIDVGQGRCGVTPGKAAVALVHEVRKHPALRFAGLQAYHGKAQHVRSPAERRDMIAVAAQDAALTRRLIEAEGIPVDLITGAGTGSLVCEAASGIYGEVQAGSFMFMDADYGKNERDPAQPQFENALFVKTQVMSASQRHAVCDAGHKSHAIDSGLPLVHTFDDQDPLAYSNGGDEHGILKPAASGGKLPAIGATLWLVPGHCDPTVNLHDVMIGVTGGLRDGKVSRILPVDARGALT